MAKMNPNLVRLAQNHSDTTVTVNDYKTIEPPAEQPARNSNYSAKSLPTDYSGCGCFDYLIVCDNHSVKSPPTDYY